MVRITPRTTTTKPKSQNFGVGFLVVASLKYEGMLLKIKWSFSELSTVPADSRYFVLCADIYIDSGEPQFATEVTADEHAPPCRYWP